MIRLTKTITAAFITASLAFGAPASAVTVTYSFTNVVGNIAGTVFGHIDGLLDNATSSATAVWVDSYPAALGTYSTPFNVFNWGSFSSDENSFTMVGGVVTVAHFHADGASISSTLDRLYLDSQCACAYGTGHTNFLSIDSNDARYVWNVGNFQAADGLLISGGAVPEPASWALMITGFGLSGAMLRRRRMAGVIA